MLKKKVLISLCCLSILSAQCVALADNSVSEEPVIVTVPNANETANDFFKLYNAALLEDYNQLQIEYLEVKERLEQAEQEIKKDEYYNSVLDEAELYQKEAKADIDRNIKMLLYNNSNIVVEIEKNIEGDWDAIKEKDLNYKRNLTEIDGLLEEKNKFTITQKRVIDYDSLDALGQELESLKDTYKEAVEVAVLGDVNNVKFPLGKESKITSKFGNRIDPMTGTSIRFHAGIDLRAAIGTPVLSVFNGVVTATGYGVAGGYYVKIDHGNGIVSYYCHLAEITCKVGDKVNQYDQVALSGNTGTRTTGPHLHFGMYIDGNPVDPNILFRR